MPCSVRPSRRQVFYLLCLQRGGLPLQALLRLSPLWAAFQLRLLNLRWGRPGLRGKLLDLSVRSLPRLSDLLKPVAVEVFILVVAVGQGRLCGKPFASCGLLPQFLRRLLLLPRRCGCWRLGSAPLPPFLRRGKFGAEVTLHLLGAVLPLQLWRPPRRFHAAFAPIARPGRVATQDHGQQRRYQPSDRPAHCARRSPSPPCLTALSGKRSKHSARGCSASRAAVAAGCLVARGFGQTSRCWRCCYSLQLPLPLWLGFPLSLLFETRQVVYPCVHLLRELI